MSGMLKALEVLLEKVKESSSPEIAIAGISMLIALEEGKVLVDYTSRPKTAEELLLL